MLKIDVRSGKMDVCVLLCREQRESWIYALDCLRSKKRHELMKLREEFIGQEVRKNNKEIVDGLRKNLRV